jgi:uncharacterized membrane protein YeaQ/YmgE (transglycosylase-associated protein family)
LITGEVKVRVVLKDRLVCGINDQRSEYCRERKTRNQQRNKESQTDNNNENQQISGHETSVLAREISCHVNPASPRMPDRAPAPAVEPITSATMLILAIIVAGMAVGWIAQFLLGRNSREIDWRIAFLAGIGGSFVGGLLASLIAGDGLALRPSGMIGSIVGAVVITLTWQQVNKKRLEAALAAANKKPWDKA